MKQLVGQIIYYSFLIFIISCNSKELIPTQIKSNKKEVSSLSLKNVANSTVSFSQATNTYTISVPFGTNINTLMLSFLLSDGATSIPKSESIQNFSAPIDYIITAEDGSKISFKVVVIVLPKIDIPISKSSEKDIIDFQLTDYIQPLIGRIIENFNTIVFHTPDRYIDIQRVKTKIMLSPNATVFPESGIRTDFSSNPIYKVTAADGSTKSYTIRLRPVDKYLPTNDINYIIGTYQKNIFIVDSESGAKIWEYECDSELTSPTSDGKNIFASSKTKLYAFKLDSGKLLWTSNFDTQHFITREIIPILDDSKSTIFYPANDDGLYAISVSTGNRLWKYNYNNSPKVKIYGFISYSNNMIFSMFRDEVNEVYKLVALSTSNGSKRWEFESKFQFYHAPKIYNGKIFIATSWKNLYSVDISNGTKVWEYIETSSYPKFSHSVIYNGILYIGSSFDLLAFDTNNGNLKWRTSNEDYVEYGPYIDGGVLYLNINKRSSGSTGVRIHTINPATGAKLTTKIFSNFVNTGNLLVYKKIILLSNGISYYPIDGNTNTICYSGIECNIPCLITKSGNVILSSVGGN